MKLESRDVILRPVDAVYELLRDHLDELVPYLPSVKRIERIESTRVDGKLEVVNHWYAVSEVPKALRRVIKPEMFSWKDYASWNDDAKCVDYRLVSFLAADLYDARGTNSLHVLGDDRTELRVSCTVDIHPDRVPGVPTFLVAKTMPVIEALVRQLLGPNLRSVGKGVSAYYREQTRAAGI